MAVCFPPAQKQRYCTRFKASMNGHHSAEINGDASLYWPRVLPIGHGVQMQLAALENWSPLWIFPQGLNGRFLSLPQLSMDTGSLFVNHSVLTGSWKAAGMRETEDADTLSSCVLCSHSHHCKVGTSNLVWAGFHSCFAHVTMTNQRDEANAASAKIQQQLVGVRQILLNSCWTYLPTPAPSPSHAPTALPWISIWGWGQGTSLQSPLGSLMLSVCCKSRQLTGR